MEKHYRTYGYEILSGQATVFEFSEQTKELGTKEFRILKDTGSKLPSGSVTIMEKNIVLQAKMMRSGRVLWEQSSGANNYLIDSFIEETNGESIQTVQDRKMRATAQLMTDGIVPPIFFFARGAENGFGSSSLTADGVDE